MNKRDALKIKPVPPAVVTDLQRLDDRLTEAAHRLARANDELHSAEVAHRMAREALDAELERLAARDRRDEHG